MPTLEAALVDHLTNDGAVSAIVDDRVMPLRIPEGTVYPAITYQRISAVRTYTYDAASWARARMQVDCWATTANVAMTLGEAVLAALTDVLDDLPHGSSFNVNEFDDYEPATKLFRRSLDFHMSYADDLSS